MQAKSASTASQEKKIWKEKNWKIKRKGEKKEKKKEKEKKIFSKVYKKGVQQRLPNEKESKWYNER